MSGQEKNGARFVIDASQGSITAQAFAEGIFSFAGHNPTFAARQFGGEIQLAANDAEVASMLVAVRTDSLWLIDDLNEKNRAEIEKAMREKVLQTAKFPEIYFVSKDVSMRQSANGKFTVKAIGTFSARGENQSQTIEAVAEISAAGIRATGEFFVRQSDFDIAQYKALGGTLKVKEEVKIRFDIAARI